MDYGEVSLDADWPVWLNQKCCIKQIANRPHTIRDAKRNARRSPQCLMNAAEVVVSRPLISWIER